MRASSAARQLPRVLLLFIVVFLVLMADAASRDSLPFTTGARFSDAVTSHYTAALYLRDTILTEREFPDWRDTFMGGAPFAANPLNKTAYPLQWLALLFEPVSHLNVMLALHTLIGVTGMLLFARHCGLSPVGWGVAGAAYVFSPRLFGLQAAGHLDLLYAMAWLPWVVWLAGAIVKHPRRLTLVPLAVSAAMLALADLRLAFFGFLLAGAYGLFRLKDAPTPQRTKILARVLTAGAVALVLTAALWMPLLYWAPHLSRAGLTPSESALFSLDAAALFGLVLPQTRGNPETITYLGVWALMLAAGALAAWPRRHLFWIAAAVVAVLWALGQNSLFWRVLNDLLPPLNWLRVPARAWLIVVFIASMLAGFGIDMLRTQTGQPARRARFAVLLVGMIACIAGAFAFVNIRGAHFAGALAVVGGLGGAAALLLISVPRRGRVRLIGAAVLGLVFTIETVFFTALWTDWRTQDDWLTPYKALAARLQDMDTDYIYSPTYSLPQEAAETFGLRLFGGVDPFQLADRSQAIMQAGGIEFSGYSVVMPPLVGIEGDEPATANRGARLNALLLAENRVSHVIAAYPLEDEGLNYVSAVDGVYIYEVKAYDASAGPVPDDPRRETGRDLTATAYLLSGIGWLSLVGYCVWRLTRRSAG
jgi:hypothetical protein